MEILPRKEDTMADRGALPGEPTMADAGLRVLAKDDGVWLEFESSNGGRSTVKVDEVAERMSGRDADVIRQWCEDQHVRTTL
jgi:hypothetical protein